MEYIAKGSPHGPLKQVGRAKYHKSFGNSAQLSDQVLQSFILYISKWTQGIDDLSEETIATSGAAPSSRPRPPHPRAAERHIGHLRA